jgi:hypothetical protein
MFEFETSQSNRKSGSAMIGAVVILMGMMGLLFLSITVSTSGMGDARRNMDKVRARYVAEAGFEHGMLFLNNAVGLNSAYDPMNGLEALLPADGSTSTPIISTPLMNGNSQVGAYTVTMTRVGSTATSMIVQLDVTGYLPDARLLGGSASLIGDLLPRTMKTPEILRWQTLDADPNRYVGVAVEE